jgi:starch synthase
MPTPWRGVKQQHEQLNIIKTMQYKEDSTRSLTGTSMKILHVAAECFPLIKTGGLADVVGSLPLAQRRIGIDARVALPGYRGLSGRLEFAYTVAAFDLRGFKFSVTEAMLNSVDSAEERLPVYLFECPELYDRPGDPYRDAQGNEHPDNALRFGLFAEAVSRFASHRSNGFSPALVHLHDWQAAPVAAWLSLESPRPSTLLTIHNLAYQGVFDHETFRHLGLPQQWWSPQAMEFWGKCSFLKAGIQFADALTTVSPGYAREIQTPEYGCGLDGDLRSRSADLSGILNGIDTAVWNPQTDPFIPAHYTAGDVNIGKGANKSALQRELGLAISSSPLVAFVGRLADQKGADLILAAREELLRLDAQYVVLANGDHGLEQAFAGFAGSLAADRVAVRLLHDEILAHKIFAAADLLLIPSRFEPCGLTQMYAQRYGTLPVARRTGGLIDTVVDADAESLAANRATGVHFLDADAGGLLYGVRRSLALIADAPTLDKLRQAAMARDFSWLQSAADYEKLYRRLQESRRAV